MFIPMSGCVIPVTTERRAYLRVGLGKEDFMKTMGPDLGLKRSWTAGG